MLRLIAAVAMLAACSTNGVGLPANLDAAPDVVQPDALAPDLVVASTGGSGGQSSPDVHTGAGGAVPDAWAGAGGSTPDALPGTGGHAADAWVASGPEVQPDTMPAGQDTGVDVLAFSAEAGPEAAGAGPEVQLPKCAVKDYGGCLGVVSPKADCKLAGGFRLADGGIWDFRVACPSLCGLCAP